MDKTLMLMTEQHNFIRVRASHIRVLWMDASNTSYRLHVDGVPKPFEITEVSAREAGEAMDLLALIPEAT